jgi:hypothetical protein
VNCTVVPTEADGFAGVTAIELKTAATAVTVKFTDVEWVVLPLVPLMVIV